MRRRALLAAPLLALGAAQRAAAQAYPTRPVRVIVPYPPGGGIDILVRAIGPELTGRWGQPVVIENRPGAGGLIGTEVAARAAPDGYTLLASVNQNFTANRFLYRALPYDPDRDFLPITLMVGSDQLLVAHPSLPADDLRALVALAHQQPGALTYGSFGAGTQPQLVFETLNRREGLDLLHVPYNGIAPLLLAATRGEVMLTTGSANVAGELIRAGRLKPLAVGGRRRLVAFPDVPTTAEAGYGYLQASIWYGLFAPAGTPPAVAERIGGDVRAVLTAPAFAAAQVRARGLDLVAGTSEELAGVIREETAAVAEMIRAAGIEPQ